MYDVYLGGVTTPEWREDFKSQISSDIEVFDPYLIKFEDLDITDKAEQSAREFYFMEQCNILVFYLDTQSPAKSVRLQIGDAVGRGKQVIVCLDGEVQGKTYIKQYCEYRGVILSESLSELIRTVEEYTAELELCHDKSSDCNTAK